MQRILHITGSMDRGGAETMIMNLYRNIDRSKFQFDFIFFTTKESDYEQEILKYGGKIHRILASNPIQQFRQLVTFFKLNRGYKIVHSHTLLNSGLNLFAAKLAGVPNRIAHAHSTNDLANKTVIGKLYKLLSLRMIKVFATDFIACGIDAANFLFSEPEDVLILQNAIDTKEFADIGEIKKNYINEKFDISHKTLKIIQVGRLQEVKNHKFSIEIAIKLKELEIPFKMIFVGQGRLYTKIENQIKDKNLIKEVLLLGLRTDIPELMAGADAMLMPSLYEGFPVVLVESQAVGLPAVISNKISSEVDLGMDLISFVDLDDIEAWINKLNNNKIKDKSNKQDRLQKLKQKGFDVKANAKILSSLYNSMN